jgi:hypothetical protein
MEMKQTKKFGKKYVYLIISIIIGAVSVKHCSNKINEYYSEYAVSYSKREAAKKGILIGDANIEPNMLLCDREQIPIIEAWIEQKTKKAYRLLFYEDLEVLDGFYLVVRIQDRIPIHGNERCLPFLDGNKNNSMAIRPIFKDEVLFIEELEHLNQKKFNITLDKY